MDENEVFEPLATEDGQDRIVEAINNISSLTYAARAETAATEARQSAGEALQSKEDAEDSAQLAREWAVKTDSYVDTETITIPAETEGEEDTTETVELYSSKYYAQQALDYLNQLTFDDVPTQGSTSGVTSGAVYDALETKADKSDTYTKTETDTLLNDKANSVDVYTKTETDTLLNDKADQSTTYTKTETDTLLDTKADKSDTYTKEEVDTALSNVQGQLTFDDTPTQNSTNPVTSDGIYNALSQVQESLVFDDTPTENSDNPVKSGGIYTALQNVNIAVDDTITEESTNPVTSAAIYDALENAVTQGSLPSGLVIETLYTGDGTSVQVNEEYQLSETWKNYDVLEFVFSPSYGGKLSDENPYINRQFVTKKSLQDCLALNQNARIGIFSNNDGSGSRHMSLRIFDAKFVCHSAATGNYALCLEYINGIKFSKNYTEQMSSNVLYENASGISSGTFTLSDDWNNYDFITVEVWNGSTGAKNQHCYSKEFLEECYSNNKDIIAIRYTTSQVTFKPITDYKTFSINNSTDNGKIYKIVGYKMAKGGYSGIVSDARMTVKRGTVEATSTLGGDSGQSISVTFDSSMPDDSYVVSFTNLSEGAYCSTLTTLMQSQTASGFTVWIHNNGGGTTAQKPKFNWIAIRPNSYTREGMVEDVLFENASGVSSGTINLSGNISDYDLISIKGLVIGETYGKNICVYPSSDIINTINNANETLMLNGKTDEGKSSQYVKFYAGNDSSIVIDSVSYIFNRYFGICEIVGIKFGRYVSGVAVDDTVEQDGTGLVTGGAVYNALQNVNIAVDDEVTETSTNPVTSAAIYAYVDSAIASITNANGVSY